MHRQVSCYQLVALAVATLLAMPAIFGPTPMPTVLAQGASQPASLDFFEDSGKTVLEAPFNNSAPGFSTANLTAIVRDNAGQPVKGAVVAFANGNVYIPDYAGALDDYEVRLTDADGKATATYTINEQDQEGYVNLYATLVVNPNAPTGQTNLISRGLQFAINNVANSANSDIDAAARSQEQAAQYFENDQPTGEQATIADVVAESRSTQDLKLAVNAFIDPGSNQGDAALDTASIGVQVLGAATKAITAGGSQTPPNLGSLFATYSLEIDDENYDAASLDSTNQSTYLNFTQTTNQDYASSGSLRTWSGESQLNNTLYLNPRAWGSRSMRINIQLFSKGAFNRDQLARQYEEVETGVFLLAEQTLSFNQQNPDQPVLKLDLHANPAQAEPGAKLVVIEGTFTVNGQPTHAELEVTATSSDQKLGRVEGGGRARHGKVKLYYYPSYDQEERQINFQVVSRVTEGVNFQVADEFGQLESQFGLKQLAIAEEKAAKEPQSESNDRVLLGEKKGSRFTMKIYGNRSDVVALPYFRGRTNYSLGGGDFGRSGTSIHDLSLINSYRHGTASYMIITAELTDMRGDPISGELVTAASTARMVGNISPGESNLLAARRAQTDYFMRQDVPSGMLRAEIRDIEKSAEFFYAPSKLSLKPGEKANATITFKFDDISLDVAVPVISKYDYTGEGSRPTLNLTTQALGLLNESDIDQALRNTDNYKINKQKWLAGGYLVSTNLSNVPNPPETAAISLSSMGQVFVPGAYKAAEARNEFNVRLGQDFYVMVDTAEVTMNAKAITEKGTYEDKITLSASGGSSGGDNGDEGGQDGGGGDGDEGGEEPEDDQDEQPPVDGRTPIEKYFSDSWLGLRLGIKGGVDQLGVGETQKVSLVVDVPADVNYAPNKASNFLQFRVFNLNGSSDSQVKFEQIDQSGRRIQRPVTKGVRWWNAATGDNFFKAYYAPETRKFVVGEFTIKKGTAAQDELAVQMFYYASGSSQESVQQNRTIVPVGTLTLKWNDPMVKGTRVGAKIVLSDQQPPVQDIGGDMGSAASGEEGDEGPYGARYFDFDPDLPLSVVNLDESAAKLKSIINASSGLSDSDKQHISDRIDKLVSRPTPYNANVEFGTGVGETIDRRFSGSDADEAMLHKAALEMIADAMNYFVRGQQSQIAANSIRFFDQAMTAIKRDNINAVIDLAPIFELNQPTNSISQYLDRYLGWKPPVSLTQRINNLFSVDTSLADTGNAADATAPVSIWSIFTTWLAKIFRR